MTPFRFILASLRHYRRIHLAVAAGVATATAVLTGALLVGDSVRGSLRDLTLERLGRIDSALVVNHLFREALASELNRDPEFKKHFVAAEPAILMTGTLQSGSGGDIRRATQVSVVGSRDDFWRLGSGGPVTPLAGDQVALTEQLADELGVKAGDSVLIRIPKTSAMPSDSVLGEKSETSHSQSFQVAEVLANKGLARFGLQPSQHTPRSAFVPLSTLQQLLEQPKKVNAILVATHDSDQPAGVDAQRALDLALRPKLEDCGLTIQTLDSPTRCIQVSANQLVLPDAVVAAAENVFAREELQPAVTYLANRISVGQGDAERSIPYSTITGVDSTAALGPLLSEAGEPIRLGDDEIALNRWAADNLLAKIGDTIPVTFYEPESTHGELHEHAPVSFRLAHIADLQTPNGEPTAAADPNLTPELPGVTDQASIDDWKLPFELTETIRNEDEQYWDDYRTTPKAFVSLATAKRLWASRWGTISLLRIPISSEAASAAQSVSDKLQRELDPTSHGMVFLPVKQQGLDAASGTTPFDGLFLGFSFFLIAAAVLLIALLFQLGIQQRAAELGILSATGVGQRGIARLLSKEGLIVAAIGALIGSAAGVLYASLMITGLRTWWVDAIATPFLELHVTARSLLTGWFIGVLVSWLTIRWSIRRLVRLPAGRLLAGQTSLAGEQRSPKQAQSRRQAWPIVRGALILVIIALLYLGWTLRAEAQAGAFFGSGAAVLLLLLGEIRLRLRATSRHATSRGSFGLASLSRLNVARSPGRSALTIGLVAAASFLIVAIGAFRLETTDAGTGGFDLLATSDRPIHFDLNTPEGRLEVGFLDNDSERLANWRIYSLRVAAGEDASCLNLYRPAQPRVLGVPEALMERGGFAFGDSAEIMASDHRKDNRWTLLRADLRDNATGRPIVPVVLDMSTAYYSLRLSGVGARLEIRDTADQPVTLEIVGLLKNSVLQGSLLVSEANFLKMFPDIGGHRFFLLEEREAEAPAEPPAAAHYDSAGASPSQQIAQILESTLATDGFDAVGAREKLAGYLAVQNTYLSTFQSLGALGLLLGTVGLAIVQLRSVIERRGELALMRAAGFNRGRLVRMVVWENTVLLLGGLAVGCAAAAVATMPQWAMYGADVPWTSLAVLLVLIAAVGVLAGWLATRSALRAPLVPALRGD